MNDDGHNGEKVSSMAKGSIQGQSPIQQLTRTLKGIGQGGQNQSSVLDKLPVEVQHAQNSLQDRLIRQWRKRADDEGVDREGLVALKQGIYPTG